MTGRRSVGIGAAMFVVASVCATDSIPVSVDCAFQKTHWSTVFTNSVPLKWDWNADTTQVALEIHGMGSSIVTNFTLITSNYVWQAFGSDIPLSEDAYTLVLTCYTNGIQAAESFTSHLAVVTGAFGETPVNAISNSPAWARVRADVVVPYDATFATMAMSAASARLVIAKIGGMVQTNTFADAAGYFGWKIKNSGWGCGVFDLSLTFPGTTAEFLTAELTRPLDGTLVKMW